MWQHAASQLSTLHQLLDKDKVIIEKVRKELQDGGTALAECQEHTYSYSRPLRTQLVDSGSNCSIQWQQCQIR